MDKSAQRAGERLRMLASQIQREHGGELQAKELAKRLGITPDILSHIRARRRGAGQETVENVVRAVDGLSYGWFYDAALESDDYHDYLGGRPSERAQDEVDENTAKVLAALQRQSAWKSAHPQARTAIEALVRDNPGWWKGGRATVQGLTRMLRALEDSADLPAVKGAIEDQKRRRKRLEEQGARSPRKKRSKQS